MTGYRQKLGRLWRCWRMGLVCAEPLLAQSAGGGAQQGHGPLARCRVVLLRRMRTC